MDLFDIIVYCIIGIILLIGVFLFILVYLIDEGFKAKYKDDKILDKK